MQAPRVFSSHPTRREAFRNASKMGRLGTENHLYGPKQKYRETQIKYLETHITFTTAVLTVDVLTSVLSYGVLINTGANVFLLTSTVTVQVFTPALGYTARSRDVMARMYLDVVDESLVRSLCGT